MRVSREKMTEREIDNLRSAFASTRMEGFEITEQMVEDCWRFYCGEISATELAEEIVARYKKEKE